VKALTTCLVNLMQVFHTCLLYVEYVSSDHEYVSSKPDQGFHYVSSEPREGLLWLRVSRG
jgi:hypothetical protein